MWLFRLSMSWIVALNPLVLAKDFHLSFFFLVAKGKNLHEHDQAKRLYSSNQSCEFLQEQFFYILKIDANYNKKPQIILANNEEEELTPLKKN